MHWFYNTAVGRRLHYTFHINYYRYLLLEFHLKMEKLAMLEITNS